MEIIKLLLDLKADLEVTDSRGYTPLGIATAAGNAGLVDLLLSQGANPHHLTNRGHSCLYLAAGSANRELIRLLLRSQASLSFTDMIEGSRQCLELVAEEGVGLGASDLAGRNLLHWAAWEGKLEPARWILKAGGSFHAEAVDRDGWTPLHYAAKEGRLEVVRLLLEHGADPLSEDRWGASPLYYSTTPEIDFLFKSHLKGKRSKDSWD